jgi:hypothetical protein
MSDQSTVDLGVGNLVTCRGITGTNATGDCTILVQPEAYGTYIPGLKEAAAGSLLVASAVKQAPLQKSSAAGVTPVTLNRLMGSGNFKLVKASHTFDGSAENIAHGMGSTPSFVFAVPFAAPNSVWTVLPGTHNGTNIVLTGTATLKAQIFGFFPDIPTLT